MYSRKQNSRALAADPPFVHQTQAQQISPADAQRSLARYLTKSRSHPYMHPDSFLANSGIRFAIGSGPSGGVALHHLRRIEAGLRGEYREKETPEQLEALFGDRWKDAGDDHVLDGMIDKSEQKLRRKRKRQEEIEEWASSSQPDADDVNDQYRGYVYHHHEIESFANTPVHRPTYGEEEESQWQDPHDYDLQQKVLTRDPQSGEQGGAAGTMVAQGGDVPGLTLHDREGNVVSEPKKNKEERKAAKKARKEQEKKEMIQAAEQKKVEEREEEEMTAEKRAKVLDTEPERPREREEPERKAEKRARKEERKRKKLGIANGVEEEEEEDLRVQIKSADGVRNESDDDIAIQKEYNDADREERREEKRRRKQERREKKAKGEKG